MLLGLEGLAPCQWTCSDPADPCRSTDHWECVHGCGVRVALIWARLHMDLIGWEIIIYQERKWWRVKWKNAVKTEDLRKNTQKKINPSIEWLFLSVLWHSSNASHENVSYFTTLIPVYVSRSAFPVEFSFWHVNIFLNSQDTGTYLALATSRVSLKRKRCLSWVCRPVFSCAWAWPKNRRAGHSARKAWTRGHDSGLTGVRQLSLRTEKNKTIGYWLILDKYGETIS